MSNPFFEDWNTPYGIPPFDRIQNEHYLEAFERGFAEQNVEIDRITQNQAPANFTNTIEALERSGALLAKTGMVFSNLSSSDTNDSLQAIELALAPKYAAHEGRLLNNQALFERVKQVYSSLPEADLDADQVKLCEDAYTRFVRAGAALEEQARDQVMALDETLAELQTQFSQNLLKDTNEFELVIDATEDIAGLSQTTLQAAKAEAQQRGKTNSYVFTVSRSSITPCCNLPTHGNSGKKCTAPIFATALTTMLITTSPLSARSPHYDCSALSCWATRAMPTTCWMTEWPRTLPTSANCWGRSGNLPKKRWRRKRKTCRP